MKQLEISYQSHSTLISKKYEVSFVNMSLIKTEFKFYMIVAFQIVLDLAFSPSLPSAAPVLANP